VGGSRSGCKKLRITALGFGTNPILLFFLKNTASYRPENNPNRPFLMADLKIDRPILKVMVKNPCFDLYLIWMKN
jgi:hypothetical protein